MVRTADTLVDFIPGFAVAVTAQPAAERRQHPDRRGRAPCPFAALRICGWGRAVPDLLYDRPMLDHDEFERWLEASDDEATLASHLVDQRAFNAVVLHSEQAAQLVVKGLLRGVGAARDAWGHALPELAERAGAAAGLGLPGDLAERLAVLERDYKPSRYPDALVSGTPRTSYGPADAERALETLQRLRAAVVAAWEQLADAEAGDGAPKGEQ